MNTQQQKIKKTNTTPPNPASNHLTQPPKQSNNKVVAAFCLFAQQNLVLFLKHIPLASANPITNHHHHHFSISILPQTQPLHSPPILK